MAFDKATEIERRILNEMRCCVHFTGIQHDNCKAGVNYRALVGGPDFSWAARLPCTSDEGAPQCASLRRPTREEAEADVKNGDEGFQRVNACFKAIREKHGKTRGVQDSMPCPNRCGGTLSYSIASYNGHVHGRCTTEGCASWMQ